MTYSKAIDNNFIFSICASWVILLINLGHDGVQFVTNLLIPPFDCDPKVLLVFHQFQCVAIKLYA